MGYETESKRQKCMFDIAGKAQKWNLLLFFLFKKMNQCGVQCEEQKERNLGVREDVLTARWSVT